MSNKAQMHFEVDHELKAHWKAFFALLPRKSETRVLTELMRNFLEKAKTQYKDSVLGGTSNKEEIHDTRQDAVDQQGNREGVHDEPRVAVSGSYAGIDRDREREFLFEKPESEDLGKQT